MRSFFLATLAILTIFVCIGSVAAANASDANFTLSDRAKVEKEKAESYCIASLGSDLLDYERLFLADVLKISLQNGDAVWVRVDANVALVRYQTHGRISVLAPDDPLQLAIPLCVVDISFDGADSLNSGFRLNLILIVASISVFATVFAVFITAFNPWHYQIVRAPELAQAMALVERDHAADEQERIERAERLIVRNVNLQNDRVLSSTIYLAFLFRSLALGIEVSGMSSSLAQYALAWDWILMTIGRSSLALVFGTILARFVVYERIHRHDAHELVDATSYWLRFTIISLAATSLLTTFELLIIGLDQYASLIDIPVVSTMYWTFCISATGYFYYRARIGDRETFVDYPEMLLGHTKITRWFVFHVAAFTIMLLGRLSAQRGGAMESWFLFLEIMTHASMGFSWVLVNVFVVEDSAEPDSNRFALGAKRRARNSNLRKSEKLGLSQVMFRSRT